ncbi:hypothetical protein LG299_02355 [Microbacterium lacus]|uniref:hypothetical protein n=1 Tax=Microbacterium lacus TaxID=415217 RepID=UPI0038507E84
MTPNKPRTPLRSIRIPDELWSAAQQIASERVNAGESAATVSDVVRDALHAYVSASTGTEHS